MFDWLDLKLQDTETETLKPHYIHVLTSILVLRCISWFILHGVYFMKYDINPSV